MKNRKKLLGFRSNKLWKKIIAILYYIWCLFLLIVAMNDVPEIRVSIYDMVIHKSSMILMALSFFIPILFISDFNIKKKIPLLKIKKWWSDILGFVIVFFLVICSSKIINICHSSDYFKRYDEYSQTKITYIKDDLDIVPESDKSLLTENEIIENLEDLINDNSNKNENNSEVNTNEDNKEEIKTQLIKIHYIDVGQGDSIFIELPNNQTMLIDAGEYNKGSVVANYISNLGYLKIDYLIGTHPHVDHIGGLAHIINNFTIGSIYMPKAISTSKTYENLLNTISQKGLKVRTAKSGVNILNNNDLKIDIIAPNIDSYRELNNYSAVVKITYENRKFLFMGDAETKSENEIMTDISADVVKIGHHGSDTSSGQAFVNKTKAKYVIIMVGNNNKYSHPHQTIIDRWINTGAKIYRTDLNGNIVVTSDGNSLNVSSSK